MLVCCRRLRGCLQILDKVCHALSHVSQIHRSNIGRKLGVGAGSFVSRHIPPVPRHCFANLQPIVSGTLTCVWLTRALRPSIEHPPTTQ